MRGLILAIAGCLCASQAAAQNIKCENPRRVVYNKAPAFKAPDDTRGLGVLINKDDALIPLPDRRAECLPLSVRYNNPGAIQTRKVGPWDGQIGKDSKGHAIFTSLQDGVATFIQWMLPRVSGGKRSAFEVMSLYAPPDDCIGTVSKVKNAQGIMVCPPGFPLNPTKEYASRVAGSFNKGPNEKLSLDSLNCPMLRDGMKSFLREIMTFEAGRQFCGGKNCSVDDVIFDNAFRKRIESTPTAGCVSSSLNQ